jgi:hypothetical protein
MDGVTSIKALFDAERNMCSLGRLSLAIMFGGRGCSCSGGWLLKQSWPSVCLIGVCCGCMQGAGVCTTMHVITKLQHQCISSARISLVCRWSVGGVV